TDHRPMDGHDPKCANLRALPKLRQAIDALMAQNKQLLSTKYRDHPLTGNWKGYREIHIEGDWLVIYRVEKQELQLVLTRTGSHDDLF
ncbi:type II toxin-antitoxin system YafQ family toxin, partial [Bifidobacterium adolescentis]